MITSHPYNSVGYWISSVLSNTWLPELSGWWIRKRGRLRIKIIVAPNLCTKMFKLDPAAVVFEIENLIMILQWLHVAFRIDCKPRLLSAQCKKLSLLYRGPILPHFSSAATQPLSLCTSWFFNLFSEPFAWGAHLACLRTYCMACHPCPQSGESRPLLSVDLSHLPLGTGIIVYMSLTLLIPRVGAEFCKPSHSWGIFVVLKLLEYFRYELVVGENCCGSSGKRWTLIRIL